MSTQPQRKRSTPIGKFKWDRCVCAPHRCSAATATSPKASSSMQNQIPDCETHLFLSLFENFISARARRLVPGSAVRIRWLSMSNSVSDP